MSYADEVFIANCKDILENGSMGHGLQRSPALGGRHERAHDQRSSASSTATTFQKEFPAMTLRRKHLYQERNGRAALDMAEKIEQRQRSCKGHVWDAWANEDRQHRQGIRLSARQSSTTIAEGDFDQVDRVLYDLKHNPCSAAALLTNIYVHADLSEMNLYPCAYSMTFQCHGQEAQRDTQPALTGYAHGKQLERLPVCDARSQ